MDKNRESSVRELMEVMFNIQVKSNRFMKLLTHDQDMSENLVLLLLKLKLFGFLTITEISDEFILTPGAATNMCDKLEKLNYIERIRLQEDRRVVRVTLTEIGEQKVDEIFLGFSVKQLEKITTSLTEINRLFETIEDTI